LIGELVNSYVDRKVFEARVIVGEIGRAMTGKTSSSAKSPNGIEWVQPDDFLKRMGVKIE
jgi:hypothetical protein